MNQKVIALLFAVAGFLTGCGDSEKRDAAELVNEAQVIFDGRVKGSPGKLPGTTILSGDDVAVCVEQMEQALAKLRRVQSDYPGENITAAPETQALEGAVASRLGTCKDIQRRQGL